ncbi:class I SAM-dependent methyltransferase [Candidatus Neomarinimicrobiota bacterium]
MKHKDSIVINSESKTEAIDCPYCNESKNLPWAKENGFVAVKCIACGLVYVNPRPTQTLIRESVETGVHSNVGHGRTAIAHRVGSNVSRYKRIFSSMFHDVWQNHKKLSWIDVGAGYGEIVEAVAALAPLGSQVEGIEPMKPKAYRAQARGLKISEKYLHDVTKKFDFVSLVNVYSHIPDFRFFLDEIKNVLVENGELYLETGNIGDLDDCFEVPTELYLPDHLVFAGEHHLKGYLSDAGFSIIAIKSMRMDGLINFLKNIIKKIIGRQITLAFPYTSRFRTIMIRAKLRSS